MNRRNFLRNTGILAGTGLLLQNKAFASIFSPYDFNIKMLRNNIGIFTEKGGTIGFLLGKNGTVVIDAQFPDSATHLIEELKKKNTNPLRFLLNTHHHGDHTSGNIAFKGIVDNVIAQENSLINQKAVAEKNNNLDKQLLPDKTFKYEMTIKADDDKIDANYYGPGHTNGDAVYHFLNANIMHVGDLMFNKNCTYKDFLNAGEGIATNILSARLLSLEENGIIEKVDNPGTKTRVYYKLTTKGIELLPILVEIHLWAEKYFTIPADLKARIKGAKTDKEGFIKAAIKELKKP